ncbi:MAG TPA: hypothetical protein VGL58_14005 [Caulobacteraceae bacterium]|jgi:hypothetical protein
MSSALRVRVDRARLLGFDDGVALTTAGVGPAWRRAMVGNKVTPTPPASMSPAPAPPPAFCDPIADPECLGGPPIIGPPGGPPLLPS